LATLVAATNPISSECFQERLPSFENNVQRVQPHMNYKCKTTIKRLQTVVNVVSLATAKPFERSASCLQA